MTNAIPDDVLTEVHAAAKRDWPGDREMQRFVIEQEAEAYRTLQTLDFGAASELRQAIVDRAWELGGSWDDCLSFVEAEIDAFTELRDLSAEGVPDQVIQGLKQKAAAENESFDSQLEDVRHGIAAYRYVQDTRAKVGPIRDLLVRMEGLISSECYNANIQNYSAWGVWEGEGRSFRYPTTYTVNGTEEKRKGRTSDLKPEELITGHYKFGANELSIYRALVRIIDMLEAEYGLVIPRP